MNALNSFQSWSQPSKPPVPVLSSLLAFHRSFPFHSHALSKLSFKNPPLFANTLLPFTFYLCLPPTKPCQSSAPLIRPLPPTHFYLLPFTFPPPPEPPPQPTAPHPPPPTDNPP